MANLTHSRGLAIDFADECVYCGAESYDTMKHTEPNPYESPGTTTASQPTRLARKTSAMVCAALVVLGNLGVSCPLAFFFWLAGVWMIVDSLSFRLTRGGWAAIAIYRAAKGLLAAFIIGFPFAVGNRLVFARLSPERERLPWLVAAVPGWIIALGSVVGSIQFLIQKPCM